MAKRRFRVCILCFFSKVIPPGPCSSLRASSEEFVGYFRQRGCCPSCVQKRSLLLGHRLREEVFAPVPHRQWVFTIPKRLRIYFRYDRKLLGKLCRAAWETIRDLYALEVDGDCGMPAMIGAVQSFGDLMNHHPHIHAVVPEGVFTESGYFVHIPYVCRLRATELWQEKVFVSFASASYGVPACSRF
jgi:hypothetical protein